MIEARGPLTESEMVTTAHGRVRAEAGDYILIDPVSGDTWPIKPDIFAATYESTNLADKREKDIFEAGFQRGLAERK